MNHIALTCIVFIFAVISHSILHRLLKYIGKKSWSITSVYVVGLCILVGIFFFVPEFILPFLNNDLELPLTCLLLYILVCILFLDFYATPFLGYESPTTAILRHLTTHAYTENELSSLLIPVIKKSERLESLCRLGIIANTHKRYVLTTKGRIVYACIYAYRVIVGMHTRI